MNHAHESIIEKFGLPATGMEQDWDVELADPSRLKEFVRGYSSEAFDDLERQALMKLILASLDEHLAQGEPLPEEWGEVSELLKKDLDLHRDSMEYWSVPGENDPDSFFYLTPHVRAVRRR